MHRAALAGIPIAPERWQEISAYAAAKFPNSGLAFADIHAALAHFMAGNDDAYETYDSSSGRRPGSGHRVHRLGRFHAFAAEDWDAVEVHLGAAMYTHERLGGSRHSVISWSLVSPTPCNGKEATKCARPDRHAPSTPDRAREHLRSDTITERSMSRYVILSA